jgi:hypothetical protein
MGDENIQDMITANKYKVKNSKEKNKQERLYMTG